MLWFILYASTFSVDLGNASSLITVSVASPSKIRELGELIFYSVNISNTAGLHRTLPRIREFLKCHCETFNLFYQRKETMPRMI